MDKASRKKQSFWSISICKFHQLQVAFNPKLEAEAGFCMLLWLRSFLFCLDFVLLLQIICLALWGTKQPEVSSQERQASEWTYVPDPGITVG